MTESKTRYINIENLFKNLDEYFPEKLLELHSKSFDMSSLNAYIVLNKITAKDFSARNYRKYIAELKNNIT